jgi:SH3-like domain-containing protein
MQSYTKIFNLFILVCFVSLVSVGFAQEAVTSPAKSASAGEAEEGVPSFPYIAEITGDDVNIRSGPGTNYYRCGKLNKADRVKVVGSQFSWSRVVPPAGSFSWISKQYVSIDPSNPTVGTVTGDAVRVYAGSEHLKPIHSTTVQLKFNRGDKVRLLGEEEGDYYKIAPPAGTYLWVSTKYTKPLGPVGEVELIIEPQPEPKAETREVVYTDASVEARRLREYYALQKQMEAERAKPMARQNYANIKKKLVKITEVKEAGKAARYSEFAIKQIENFELALTVAKEVRLQDEQLQRIKKRIENARVAKLAQVPEQGRFAVIGQFQTSNIRALQAELKHYRIMDDFGKTLCYAVASGSATGMDLSEFLGRKVGLLGTIEPHPDPETGGALVRFDEIVDLQ